MMYLINGILIFIAFSQCCLQINSQTIQSGLLSQRICLVDKQENYPGHYKLVQLKCDWHQFLIYLEQNANLTVSNQNQVFEIEFVRRQSYSMSKVSPYEIKSNLFEKFNIRKLTFINLEIKKVHPNAFKSCCEDTLLHLDLSRNKLKRIDQDALSNLKALRHLNLASNPNLQLANENFKGNHFLTYLNLSSTDMEYLPEKLLSNLNLLETIDISNNNLRNLDACTFYPIYSGLKSVQNLKSENNISEVNVNALNNNIECSCDVFYLERAANINLDLVCAGEPKYYNGKNIATLAKEDPNSVNCFYKSIEFNCRSKYEDSNDLLKSYELHKVLLIVFITLFSVFFAISIFLWCKIRSKNQKRSTENIQDSKKGGYSLAANKEYKALQQSNE